MARQASSCAKIVAGSEIRTHVRSRVRGAALPLSYSSDTEGFFKVDSHKLLSQVKDSNLRSPRTRYTAKGTPSEFIATTAQGRFQPYSPNLA